MARYQFNGSVTTVFPTVPITVNPGDVFEAPDGFSGLDCVETKAKVTPVVAPVVAPVEAVSDPIPDASEADASAEITN